MAALQSGVPNEATSSAPPLSVFAALTLVSGAILWLFSAQAPGVDFSCFWAGAKVAVHGTAPLYDFRYITALQGWPLGPHSLRPFIYPPSALFLFIPFAIMPYWLDYGLWVLVTGGLFLWAARKAGAPWWLMLAPPVVVVIYCGQVTLLIGGLVIGGLAMAPRRPIVAGVLFGLAAAVKPQLLVLVPVAMLAEGRWRTLAAAGATGAALVAASVAAWGVEPWFAWLSALHRFHTLIFAAPQLIASLITPYGALLAQGLNGAWAFLLAPLAIWLAWSTFRRSTDVADRSIAIFAGALLISPYAMYYEAALLAPAVAAYLARTDDRRRLAVTVMGVVCLCALPRYSILSILAALALLALRRGPPRPTPSAKFADTNHAAPRPAPIDGTR
jgi:hypothetical protein